MPPAASNAPQEEAMDIKGKIVVITGATSGLGQAAAIDFAKAGAKVFVVGRDAMRAAETQTSARNAGGEAEVIIGDVSTRAGVKAVAQAILAKTARVDVLVNNAGGTFKTFSRSADGIEATFALNTLSAFVLAQELRKALAAAHGRVVNLVTGFLGTFPVDVEGLVAPKKYGAFGQYGRAKHASLMMTIEEAKRFAADGVTVVALHPGVIMGTRFGGGQPKLAQMLGGPIMRGIGFASTIEEAVDRFRVACFGDVPSGSYLVRGKPAPLPKQSNDEATRANVLALLERLAAPPSASA
jgi:NAD(P)-dependent dehydrogenase (short-subunit alcohol dehydrogenase family)